MSTTSLFQKYPDYYNSHEECVLFEKNYNKEKSNPRYKNFKQINFTAGDEEQFNNYKYEKNNIDETLVVDIKLDNNLFLEYKIFENWEKYKNLNAISISNTFKYIFNKFKKGIFVKIVNNNLMVFLPFSNVNFINEWSNNIKIEAKYGNIYNFFSYISKLENRRFIKSAVNNFINTWYSNNSLLRYEYPIGENDTNISCLKNMLEELCEKRIIPDIEFFINKRDYPIITKNNFEPYYNIWDSKNIPLVSHNYDKYCPILSMSSNTTEFSDVLMPCHDDWIRVQNLENKWFPYSRQKNSYNFDTKWEDKKNIAIFRGSSTGTGVTIKTNQRLHVAYLSTIFPKDENNIPYLDAGITKWNVRPRKIMGEKYLQTIDIDNIPFKLVDSITPDIQSTYKYIIHIDGHTSAFRLSYQLNMNSVLLIVKSEWKMWYTDMLKEYIHFVPVKEDLSDLLEKIKWCRNNENKCKEIASNAKRFYNKYLQKDGILDYCQKLLTDIKTCVGSYKYNNTKPIDIQVKIQYDIIKNKKFYRYPKTTKSIQNIQNIPNNNRCYGLLKGIHYIVNLSRESKYINILTQDNTLIFENKLSSIKKYKIANFYINIKSTNDSEKIKEHIHETFVGLNCINKICKEIPNFSYNFGLYESENNYYNIISENIDGITFQQYIKSAEFCFKEYLLILLQICAALECAQKKYAFVHNDLTIWNIIILKTKEPVQVEYLLSHKKIIKLETNIIPVIIDYGKSHVIYENFHYGIINMYKFSTITDVLSILITSIYQIIIDKKLEKNDFCNLIKLSNFISNTKFCKNTFKNSKDIKDFFHNAKKYSNLINTDKFELEKYTPVDLFEYILKLKYDFKISYLSTYNSFMNNGNENQIFNYILSNTIDEKIESFIDIFKKIKDIKLNKIEDIFDLYFIHEVKKNIISVKKDMCNFMKDEKIENFKYIDHFNTSYNFISNIHMNDNFLIDYSHTTKYDKIIYNIISPDVFLFPEKIKDIIKLPLLHEYQLFYIKIKYILESLICDENTFIILNTDILTYKKILDIKEKNVMYNYANINTVKIVSKFL